MEGGGFYPESSKVCCLMFVASEPKIANISCNFNINSNIKMGLKLHQSINLGISDMHTCYIQFNWLRIGLQLLYACFNATMQCKYINWSI